MRRSRVPRRGRALSRVRARRSASASGGRARSSARIEVRCVTGAAVAMTPRCGQAARSSAREAAIWVSATGAAAASGRRGDQTQEAEPAVSRGASAGAPPRRPQASDRDAGADRLPELPNARWSLDFASCALADGRRFRILCLTDDFTRECLALAADTSLSGMRVTRELDAIAAMRGQPATVVSDNGTELTSVAILRWEEIVGGTPIPSFRGRDCWDERARI